MVVVACAVAGLIAQLGARDRCQVPIIHTTPRLSAARWEASKTACRAASSVGSESRVRGDRPCRSPRAPGRRGRAPARPRPRRRRWSPLAARCPALSSHRGQLGAQLSGVGDGTDGDLRQRLGQHLLLDLGREEGEQRLGGRAGVQRHHHPNFERQPQLRRFHPVDAEHTHPTRLQHRQKRGLASGAGHLLELGVQVAAKIEAGRRAVAQRHGGSAEPVAPTADRAQQSLGLEGVYQPVGGGHRQPHCFGEAGRRPRRARSR